MGLFTEYKRLFLDDLGINPKTKTADTIDDTEFILFMMARAQAQTQVQAQAQGEAPTPAPTTAAPPVTERRKNRIQDPGPDKPTRTLILSGPLDASLLDKDKLPPTDVLIHCGSMTRNNTKDEYKSTIKALGGIEASLRLVMPGPNDISLDEAVAGSSTNSPEDDAAIRAMMAPGTAGALAFDSGVLFMEANSVHCFTLGDARLGNGRKLVVFANPYTPKQPAASCQDGADGGGEAAVRAFEFDPKKGNPCRIAIAEKTGIDIMMAHAAPLGYLDNGTGCAHMLDAVKKIRPRLLVFAQCEQTHDVGLGNWTSEVEDQRLQMSSKPATELLDCPVSFRKQTWFVPAPGVSQQQPRYVKVWTEAKKAIAYNTEIEDEDVGRSAKRRATNVRVEQQQSVQYPLWPSQQVCSSQPLQSYSQGWNQQSSLPSGTIPTNPSARAITTSPPRPSLHVHNPAGYNGHAMSHQPHQNNLSQSFITQVSQYQPTSFNASSGFNGPPAKYPQAAVAVPIGNYGLRVERPPGLAQFQTDTCQTVPRHESSAPASTRAGRLYEGPYSCVWSASPMPVSSGPGGRIKACGTASQHPSVLTGQSWAAHVPPSMQTGYSYAPTHPPFTEEDGFMVQPQPPSASMAHARR